MSPQIWKTLLAIGSGLLDRYAAYREIKKAQADAARSPFSFATKNDLKQYGEKLQALLSEHDARQTAFNAHLEELLKSLQVMQTAFKPEPSTAPIQESDRWWTPPPAPPLSSPRV